MDSLFIVFLTAMDVNAVYKKSSLASEDAIWLGVNNANPIIMSTDAIKHGIETTKTTGWVDYPIPKEVLLTTRMHLTREQVKELLPYLQRFVEM